MCPHTGLLKLYSSQASDVADVAELADMADMAELLAELVGIAEVVAPDPSSRPPASPHVHLHTPRLRVLWSI